MSSNVDLIKKFFEYFQANDKESYLKLCDDNIEWTATQYSSDGIGRCVGKKDIFDDYLPMFYSRFMKFEALPEEYLDAGDNVIVLGKYDIISKTGDNFISGFAQIFTIKDNKIIRFRNYADSATIQHASSFMSCS